MGEHSYGSRASGSRSTSRMSSRVGGYPEEYQEDMRRSSSSAGDAIVHETEAIHTELGIDPSSSISFHPPTSLSHGTGTSTSSPPFSSGDGFLGVVARWGEEEEEERGKLGVRTSRMIGSKFGLSPPPPPGPPRTCHDLAWRFVLNPGSFGTTSTTTFSSSIRSRCIISWTALPCSRPTKRCRCIPKSRNKSSDNSPTSSSTRRSSTTFTYSNVPSSTTSLNPYPFSECLGLLVSIRTIRLISTCFTQS